MRAPCVGIVQEFVRAAYVAQSSDCATSCIVGRMQVFVRKSTRAKYMRLRVLPGGVVVLMVPMNVEAGVPEIFLREKEKWIQKTVARMSKLIAIPVPGLTRGVAPASRQARRRAYLQYREDAREFITARVEYWNASYGFSYKRIAIKDTRTSWGSCSHKGNLNFSYTLLFLPRDLADYVVVHELCHLKECNHSPRFWALVAKEMPEYRHLRWELRRYIAR